MSAIDYDDPIIEAAWLAEQRTCVADYLGRQGITHGRLAEAPDWFVAPHVSLWRVVSGKYPQSTGWWAIAGDLPTDYLSSRDATNAREAIARFAARWGAMSESMKRGEHSSEVSIGSPVDSATLGPLLASRAATLAKWSRDEALWSEAR